MPLIETKTFVKPIKPEDIEYEFLSEVDCSDLFIEDSLLNLERELCMSREELFEDVLKKPDWKEIVVEEIGSNLSYYDEGKLKQYLAPMSSYDAQARWKFLISKRPLIGDTVLISSDNEIILGVRSGTNAINVFPTYYAKYERPLNRIYESQKRLNPLTASFYEELFEEGGLRREDIDKLELIGYFYDKEYTKGQNYVWLAHSNNSTKEILEKQKKAPDSFEYTEMFPVENNIHSISDLIRNPLNPIFPLASYALSVYAKHLKDQ